MSKGRTPPRLRKAAHIRGRRRIHRALVLLALAGWVLGVKMDLSAQEIFTLMPYSHVWRYQDSGADLGTAWREPDFDDSTWPSGPGLLQGGETTIYPAPFGTVLSPATGKITSYFRARFIVPPELANRRGVVIYATNLVDDGCLMYLNGIEAVRIRMPTAQPIYLTTASSGPATEGQYDVAMIPAEMLRAGENSANVEVHQNGLGSGDVVWGVSLVAHVFSPLSITRQPLGMTNLVGETAALSVEVTGSRPSYRWIKDGVPLSGVTNASLNLAAVKVADSGAYSVILSNAANSVTSAVVQVLILPDRSGPIVLSATAAASLAIPGASNHIDIVFNEAPSTPTVANFSVIRLRTGETIPITAVLQGQKTIRLRVDPTPAWVYYDDYMVTISGLRDALGNSIAPGTRVPVRWLRLASGLVNSQSIWHFHNSAVFDPEIYGQDWAGTNFVESGLWGTGTGPFHHYSVGFDSCFGWIGPPGIGGDGQGIDIGHQLEPTLFRTTFQWPATNDSSGTLQFNLLTDDGAVFYLNGREIHRANSAGGPVSPEARSLVFVAQPVCVTNVAIAVTNLFPGTNWIAVALLQAAGSQSDACLALGLDVRYAQIPELPAESEPAIQLEWPEPGRYQLSWDAGGYALESAPSLGSPFSYPRGPWTEVSNMANPFILTGATNEAAQFYRLKRK